MPFRGAQGLLDLRMIVRVDLQDIPVVALEALADVVAVREVGRALDRDPVEIVEDDQLVEPQVPASENDSWEMPSIMSPSPAMTKVW